MKEAVNIRLRLPSCIVDSSRLSPVKCGEERHAIGGCCRVLFCPVLAIATSPAHAHGQES